MPHEILIRNGTLIDGSGAPARRANVAVANGKIVEPGALSRNPYRTIDAEGSW
jgi:N-acyl-D-aspartate/D-glutamate deacylase